MTKLNGISVYTLDSGIDVGQEINVGHRKFGKNDKYRALNKKGRTTTIKLENSIGPGKDSKKK